MYRQRMRVVLVTIMSAALTISCVKAEPCGDFSDTQALEHAPFRRTTGLRWHRLEPLEKGLAPYGSPAAVTVARNMVALQTAVGGWMKNTDPDCDLLSEQDIESLKQTNQDSAFPDSRVYSHHVTTLDNQTTHSHIRFLLRAAVATGNSDFASASKAGLDYLLRAQYDSGGWPQNYPNLSSYGAYVTFNDGAMTGALRALQDAYEGNFPFISSVERSRYRAAFERGIEYILRAQISIDGQPSGWAQQYLPGPDLQPAQGRVYELPAVSSLATVDTLKLLRALDDPSAEVKSAVNRGIAWLQAVKIQGIRIEKVSLESPAQTLQLEYAEDPSAAPSQHRFDPSRYGFDKVVVSDMTSEPLWARFYDLRLSRPLFSDWSGEPKRHLADVDYDRRIGYMWYVPQATVDDIIRYPFPNVPVPPFKLPQVPPKPPKVGN